MGVEGVIFESHPPNFENLYTFKDVQMMLRIFFDISTGFRFSKISVLCSVHLCSCPWLRIKCHVIRKENGFFGVTFPTPPVSCTNCKYSQTKYIAKYCLRCSQIVCSAPVCHGLTLSSILGK